MENSIIKHTITFDLNQVRRFFQNNGIKIEKRPTKHCASHDNWISMDDYVCNPHTGKWELMTDVYLRIFEQQKDFLFLENVSKLTVYCAFNKG
jgi:hypothetical protein